jgi:tetratricopeptide (TPR) repeat protein
MKKAIKREDVGRIEKKLNEARFLLQQNKLHSCLLKFKEALELLLSTKMLPADVKIINTKINEFQSLMSNTTTFTETYGPVTFRDDEAKTTLEFINQLLIVKDQEIKGYVEERIGLIEKNHYEVDAAKNSEESFIELRGREAKRYIDNDNFEAAKEIIGDDDEIMWWVLQAYNTGGINFRRQGHYIDALNEFNKALMLQSDDEGLYYNIARANIEMNRWEEALDAIQKALKINPDFSEGKLLESFIKKRI